MISKRSSNRSASFHSVQVHDVNDDANDEASAVPTPRLKGRLYFRDLKEVKDTSDTDGFTLQITMTEVEGCTLYFQDKATLVEWDKRISKLMFMAQLNSLSG